MDAETHLPLMLTYMEPEPRMVMRTMTRDAASGRGGSSAPIVVPGGAAHPAGAPATAAAPAGTSPLAGLSPQQQEEIEKQRKEAEATPPKLVEYRLFFSDYRKVDGVSLPHRISRGTGAKTTEEWDITSYKVNPAFKTDRFRVGS